MQMTKVNRNAPIIHGSNVLNIWIFRTGDYLKVSYADDSNELLEHADCFGVKIDGVWLLCDGEGVDV
jgi:hypothetical protein